MKKIALVLFVLITLSSASLFGAAQYKKGSLVVKNANQSCDGTNAGSCDNFKYCENVCKAKGFGASGACFDFKNNICYCN